MRKILYFIVEAFRGFYQAKLMTFVSIMTITATLFLICGVFIGLMNIDEVLRRTSDSADVVVYLSESASVDSSAHASLIDTVSKMSGVKGIFFISKDSAWTVFETLYGREMLEAVNENPFPASLNILLHENSQSPDAVAALREKILALSGIVDIRYSKEWLDTITRLRDRFYVISLAAGLIIMLALHSIISNTIKLTIYARRDLVRNMHYVGATDLFIKMPFLLEGMLQGLIGSVLCICAMVAARVFLAHISINWYFSYLPLIILIGVYFGWLGSWLAVRKFLV
ncbi:MAG: ABC transporter permease [Chitinispirillia bacterium]|nr:ABC transporter permease [Chitinispirillia bacterium]MCL2267791.1 ABC transporter permease [Chitinispirillia bacterium]